MTMEYTKGEWKVGKPYMDGYAIPIYSDTKENRDYEIATVHIYNGEQQANSHLISACPNIYEALKALIDHFRFNDENYYKSDLCTNAICAIKKAEAL